MKRPISPSTHKKAELLSCGCIYIPKNMVLPSALSRSTAGPGAGSDAVHLQFGKPRMLVRMAVTPDIRCPFHIVKKSGSYAIIKNGRQFIKNVSLLPKIVHSPTHVFINVDASCSLGCLFCNTPSLGEGQKSLPEIIRLVQKGMGKGTRAVAFTSGVRGNARESVEKLAKVIHAIRKRFPDIVIGVEPYVVSEFDIRMLRDAGATEIKLNIQTFDRRIFRRVCPGFDYDAILENLRHAVRIFGKGKVCSNILVGLGENDSNIARGITRLAGLGIVATLRPVSLNGYNTAKLAATLGSVPRRPSPSRMLRLGTIHKKILEKHNLTTRTFSTMCHACSCCDLVPFRDL